MKNLLNQFLTLMMLGSSTASRRSSLLLFIDRLHCRGDPLTITSLVVSSGSNGQGG